MTAARIRVAHAGDADDLHALHLACWREAFSEQLSPEVFERQEREGLAAWREALVDPRGIWIAHRDGAPVGLARAVAAGPGHVRPLELAKLYVLASEYGAGTADNLLEISIGDAPCLTWAAGFNLRAQRFYTKHGFRIDDSVQAHRAAPEWGEIALLRMIR
ncbi:GNAT family N-acetyltransferase [Pseudactinotalea sp. HY160]|uniref:GNAT family N-acetyltransferase n=1 Tax=Pseudactinotalea sp. HY160 TaxID=2654490 RepID=UPI00128E0C03|nr:GNAT family N-acetyltransferase [Pseudactinotalea sp. HY160]MPV50773.1 GNAT family N-acetyltransferase [Pseudactinotalea sp. HY160]